MSNGSHHTSAAGQKIYTGSAAKEIDRLAIAEHGYVGLDLMINAGELAYAHIAQWSAEQGAQTEPKQTSILILCGAGNNGGDGYVVGRCALEAGWQVTLVATKPPGTDDASSAAAQFVQAGGTIHTSTDFKPTEYTVVVDALLGVGISGAPRGEFARLTSLANELAGLKVAIDVPTGVDADTGAAYQPVFEADKTISFIAAKLGLHTGPGLNHCGDVAYQNLNISTPIFDAIDHCAEFLPKPVFSSRKRDSHKGSYGDVIVAGGDNGMLGAALLAGSAALRMGSGKVYVLSTDEHLDQPALYRPELMSLVFEPNNTDKLHDADAVVLGPGLGLNSWGKQMFEVLIGINVPMLVDADGLTLLAQKNESDPRSLPAQNQWVLTPHPGEAARLLGITTSEVQQDRMTAVREIAQRYHCVCVLKGAGTLIAEADGWVGLCDHGNSGMATAGMGDVLSGMIGAQLAQGYAPRAAAEVGVWLHARTADQIVGRSAEAALIASDIIDRLAVSIYELDNNKETD